MRDCARRLARNSPLKPYLRVIGRVYKHRQAARLRAARKGLVEGGDLVVTEHELAGRGIVGGVFQRRGF